MYKILVLRNDRLPLSDSFDKVKAFMSLNKINVSFDFKEVKELTSVHEYKVIDGFRKDNGQPSKVSLMGLDDITKDNCRNYVKEGEYQCVIFSWDTDKLQQTLMPTETVSNFAHFKPLYPTTEFIQVAVNQYSLDRNTVWSTVAHELMHTFSYFVARRLNLPLTAFDEMDVTKDGKPYYLNGTPEAPDGNFARTFNNLKPFLYIINNLPTVTITRKSDDGVQTLGELQFGNFTCKTLEKPWKDNKKSISCVPKGQYRVKWSFFHRKLRYAYLLQNVPNRTGIFIHSGNFFFDIEGCILLGTGYKDINKDGKVDIINSTVTVKKFDDLMDKKDFILIIK